jgi:capsular exopolysaccharide synthesis family protein
MYALPRTATTAGPATPPPLAPRALLTVLARRRSLFISIVAVVAALTAFSTLLSPKTYTTHVTFIAGGGGSSGGPADQTEFPVLNAILDISNAQSSETYAEILRQPKTVELVIAKLGLNVSPGQLLAHVKAKPIPNTSILDAAVTWSSPEESARIANGLADGYVALRRELISEQAGAAADTIAAELRSASLRMRSSADNLMSYQAKNGIADLTQQTNAVLGSLAALDVKAGTTAVDLRQANAQRGVVRSELASTPATTTGGQQIAVNPVLAQLRAQLATVGVQLQTARQQYTDNHPAVQSLIAQQRVIERTIASTPPTTVASDTSVGNPLRTSLLQQDATLSSEIASDTAELTEVNRQRKMLQPAIKSLPGQAAALARLTREAKVDQDVFDALQRKYGEAQIAKSTTLSDVAIVSAADPKAYEKHPNVVLNLGIGLLLALFLGIAGVALAERFDRRIVSEDDLTERLRLPVLSSIPMLPPKTAIPEWMRAARIDSILQLVTSLRYASTERLRTIAFTSTKARDGKSVIALETAIAMAELEPRVLLLDADLRMPSLHTKLHIDRTPGLSDVLVGTANLEDVIRHTQHAGLDIITAGTSVPNAFVLLQSAAYEQFIQSVLDRYTTVLIDTPACGAVVDAAAVCARADGTVYVVSANETDAEAASRGIARLYGGGVRRIVGAVFNRTTPRRSTIGPYGELSGGIRSFPTLQLPRHGN